MSPSRILRWWLVATVLLVGGLVVWELVPVLIPIALIAGGLGGVSAIMIALARHLARLKRGSRR